MIQEKRKKKLRRMGIIWALTGILLLGGVCAQEGNSAQAAEAETAHGAQGQADKEGIIEAGLMMTSVDTLALEAPDENAAVAAEFPAGTQVMVTGKENGWYAAFYQGKTVYLAEEDLSASTAVDQEALEKEMKKAEAEGTAYIESLEMQRKALKRSQVWRTVIIVLIAAIFVVGIVSSFKKEKFKNKERRKKK